MTETREELNARELAVKCLPTPERLAKGDILTYGRAEWMPDVINEAATLPTAQARVTADRIKQLRDAGVIDDMEYHSCQRFRVYWHAATRHLGAAALDYAKERVDGGGFTDYNPERMTDADRYVRIAGSLSNGASWWLHLVVCHELSIAAALKQIGGASNTATSRFLASIDELDKLLTAE